jgi:hypothetical protein
MFTYSTVCTERCVSATLPIHLVALSIKPRGKDPLIGNQKQSVSTRGYPTDSIKMEDVGSDGKKDRDKKGYILETGGHHG